MPTRQRPEILAVARSSIYPSSPLWRHTLRPSTLRPIGGCTLIYINASASFKRCATRETTTRPRPCQTRPFSLWHGRSWGALLRLQNKAGSALKSPGYFKTEEGCMPTGKVKMFNEQRGFGFIRPDDGGADIFFHVSALREGDEITEGNAVSFETGPDLKTGKIKAISVDLT